MMKEKLSTGIRLGLLVLSLLVATLYSVTLQAAGIENYCAAFPGPAQTWEGNTEKAYLQYSALITGTYSKEDKHYLWFKLPTNSGEAGRGLEGCDGKPCHYPSDLTPERWATKLTLGTFQENTSHNYYVEGADLKDEYNQFHLSNGATETLKNGKGKKIYSLYVDGGSKLTLYGGVYWFDTMVVTNKSQLVTHGKVIIHTRNLSVGLESVIAPHSKNPDDLQIYAHHYRSTPPIPQPTDNVTISHGGNITGLLYSEMGITMAWGGNCNQTNTCLVASVTGAVTAKDLTMNSAQSAIISTVINGQSACFNPKEYFIEVMPEKNESLTCDRQKVTVRVLDKNGQVATDYTGQINLSTSLTIAGKARWFGAESRGEALGDAQDNVTITPSHGVAELWLKSEHIGSITVTATLSTDSKKTDSSTFLFVPYGFEVGKSEQRLVAGKPVNIDITALACPSEKGQMVATEYEGERMLSLETLYDLPSTGSQRIQLAKPNTSEWQSRQLALNFVAGKASAQLRYLDAGQARLTVTDKQCNTSDCTVIQTVLRARSGLPNGWQALTGTQSIKARPYTFALCDAPNERSIEQAKGTALNTENAFVAAGERFSTKVKAVIWQANDASKNDIDEVGSATKQVDTRNLCGRVETPNFYQAQAPAATVQLSIPAGDNAKPHSPNVAGARPGTLTSQSLSHQQIEDNAFYASWSEVGSIQLRAGVQGMYLGMTVNIGYRPVGRFYPKYLVVQDAHSKMVGAKSGITYPAGQEFIYMNQPFTGYLSVQALNQQKAPTYNYGYFAPQNQVGVKIVAVERDAEQGSNLLNRMDFSAWDGGRKRHWQDANITVPPSALLFTRSAVAPLMAAGSQREATYRVETLPDGPYDVVLGIVRDDLGNCSQIGCPELPQSDLMVFNCRADSVCATPVPAQSFATFTTRYGRMVMDDTAGRSGTPLAIPLRVEYWNGTAFVPHRDDSVSAFDGRYYCKQIQMQSDASVDSDTFTSGQGGVDKGVAASGQLLAQPDDTPQYREQTRFWQKLMDETPARMAANDPVISCEPGAVKRNGESQPWLLYNWRQQGDENPSALVTFGTYRGNDRVIYRGEKGMNVRLP